MKAKSLVHVLLTLGLALGAASCEAEPEVDESPTPPSPVVAPSPSGEWPLFNEPFAFALTVDRDAWEFSQPRYPDDALHLTGDHRATGARITIEAPLPDPSRSTADYLAERHELYDAEGLEPVVLAEEELVINDAPGLRLEVRFDFDDEEPVQALSYIFPHNEGMMIISLLAEVGDFPALRPEFDDIVAGFRPLEPRAAGGVGARRP